MLERPSSALLISPAPRVALEWLADALTDLDLAEDASLASLHSYVLLSGSVPRSVVTDVAAELDRRPELRVGIDLMHPPAETALEPLGRFFLDRREMNGRLPVALVTTRGRQEFSEAFSEELGGYLRLPGRATHDLATHQEALFALATELADSRLNVERLELRVGRMQAREQRTRLALQRARQRVGRLEARRVAAEQRLATLERRRLLRFARICRQGLARIPRISGSTASALRVVFHRLGRNDSSSGPA